MEHDSIQLIMGNNNDADFVTLDGAKDKFMHEAFDGAECPCCGKYEKLEKYVLSIELIRTLLWLVDEYERTHKWVANDVDIYLPQLSYWHLIKRKYKFGEPVFMPSDDGIGFSKGYFDLPKWVYLMNDKPVMFSEEVTNLHLLQEQSPALQRMTP